MQLPASALGSLPRRFIHTRPSGRVSITTLSARCYRAMCVGGGLPTSVARECAKAEAQGRDVDLTRRWATALRDGGCSDGEAMELFRRWCIPADHQAVWLVEPDELRDLLPPDRWFRDAWRRSANGGPAWIDLEAARPVQAAHVARALARENASRAARLLPALSIDLEALRRRIDAAADEGALRAVWPAELEGRT